MRIGTKCFYFGATYNFIKNKLKKKKEKIRVGFIVQELAVLNKSQLLIDKLISDERFEVLLLCIPSNIEDGNLVEQKGVVNDTYEYLKKEGYKNLINTLQDNGQWISIESLSMDYVFYNRPYNYFYPKEYRSKNVSKYCKICVLLYAMTITKKEVATTLNKEFFKDVYYYFSETKEGCHCNVKRFPVTHFFNFQKSKFTGMPAIEYFYKNKDANEKSCSWNFSKNKYKIIWTPRWTTEVNFGGSNFFEYKELLLEFMNKHRDIDLLFRPHPLLFKNFLKTGELSREEYESFIGNFNCKGNISIDEQKEYVTTFQNSNVLVSDISSVILEYLVMGKPVIFCKNNMRMELLNELNEVFEACYTVNSFEELNRCLIDLINGIDAKKEEREKVTNKYLLQPSTNLVVAELLKDYGI